MSVSGDDSDATVLADDGVDKVDYFLALRAACMMCQLSVWTVSVCHIHALQSVGEESQCVDRVCESPEATVSSSPSPSILHTTLKSLIHQRSSSRYTPYSHSRDVAQE